jgi:hypothetical protein
MVFFILFNVLGLLYLLLPADDERPDDDEPDDELDDDERPAELDDELPEL